MDGISMNTLVNACGWGLGIGSFFFILLGLLASKDFFLVLGLICCVLGNGGFASFLYDQVGGCRCGGAG